MNRILLNLQTYNISVLKKKNYFYIYIYNKNYFFLLKLNFATKWYFKNNSIIEINTTNHDKNHIDLKKLNSFLKQFYLCEVTKIKFTGKGYKIKKNTTSSIIMLFNRAHMTVIWWNNIILKKLKKYKLYIKYTPYNQHIVRTILSLRNINIFTKKGLRKSRQIVYKKKGKK